MDAEQAERLLREWIDALNRHDLDAVLSHYADEVEFTSPAAVELLGEPSGTVRGKGALRAYFEKGLAAYPDLALEVVHVLAGVDTVAVVYWSLHRRRLGAEVMRLDGQGRIARVWVHYGAPVEG